MPAIETLRQAGNPFRNFFARNPDDDICARYHVPELFATERAQLLGVVELFAPIRRMHSEVLPVLGNKGAGKTHLLHSIKHGSGGSSQLIVTPGTFQKDTDFLEYLLFQVIDTLLCGGKTERAPAARIRQRGAGPAVALAAVLNDLSREQQIESVRRAGLGPVDAAIGIGELARRRNARNG